MLRAHVGRVPRNADAAAIAAFFGYTDGKVLDAGMTGLISMALIVGHLRSASTTTAALVGCPRLPPRVWLGGVATVSLVVS